MSDYPEHEKLRAVHDQTLLLSEFYDWLESNGYHIARFHEHDDDCYVMTCSVSEGLVNADLHRHTNKCRMGRTRLCDLRTDALYTLGVPRPDALFGLFFNIDPKKLSAEKDAMYEELRAANKAA